jgi:uncharacterized repeat protein (TIGR03803 family)
MAVGNNSYEMRVYKVGQPILPNRIAYNRVILTALYLVVLSTSVGMVAAADEGTFRIVPYSGQYGPPNGLTEGSPGVFYSNGGSANQAVFSVTPQGATSILATFTTSHYIQAPLVSAANGRFYSAISYAHNPVNAFSVGPAPDSLQLYPPQTLDPMPTRNLPDGTLLGIAVALSSSPASYLVKCDLEGNTTTIYQFPAGESLPHTAIYAGDGNYYGVSVLPDGSGYVYRVTPQGALAKLLNFPPKSFRGVPGYVPLLEAGDGNLYGATATGGVNGKGNIYKLTLGGQYTLLYTFPPSRRSFSPTALIEASDGNLYGATLGVESQLFRITKSGQYTLLRTMNAYTDGQCQCQLTQGSDGAIYGTTLLGGLRGLGNVFVWNPGLPKPSPRPLRFNPESGPVGTKVLVWGLDLLSASVEFEGARATEVFNSGSNYIRVTVPPGAATGPLRITTPGGTVTTHTSFTVR